MRRACIEKKKEEVGVGEEEVGVGEIQGSRGGLVSSKFAEEIPFTVEERDGKKGKSLFVG